VVVVVVVVVVLVLVGLIFVFSPSSTLLASCIHVFLVVSHPILAALYFHSSPAERGGNRTHPYVPAPL
jgi:divalent metal cation (Fe/Co/Zn/Cd) transporter